MFFSIKNSVLELVISFVRILLFINAEYWYNEDILWFGHRSLLWSIN